MDTTFDRLIQLLGKYSQQNNIMLKSNLRTDLQLDSMDNIKLLIDLEEAFQISIPLSIILDMKTVEQLRDYIVDTGRAGIAMNEEALTV